MHAKPKVRVFKYFLVFLLVLYSFQLTMLAQEKLKFVSTSSAMTEILFGLGLGQHLVAVDSSSVYPASQVSALPVIQRNVHGLNLAGILSYYPTHIFVYDCFVSNEWENHMQEFTQLIKVPYPNSLEGTFQMIETISMKFDQQEKGHEMMTNIYMKLIKANEIVKKFKRWPRLLYIYSMYKDYLFTSGYGTLADTFMRESGTENCLEGVVGYVNINSIDLSKYDPDLILATKQTVETLGGLSKVFENSKIKELQASKENALILLDEACLNFGPRVGDFIYQLSLQLSHFQNEE